MTVTGKMTRKALALMIACVIVALCGLAGCNDAQPANTAGKDSDNQTSSAKVEALPTQQVYVSAEWVKSLVDGQQPDSNKYVILEVSWGDEEVSPYVEGHIPGAIHLNTDRIESEQDWNYRSPEEINELLCNLGIDKDTTVVCYSADAINAADDRVAVALLWAGVENVKCLDGGYVKWTQAGYSTETASVQPKPIQSFGATIPVHPEYIISIDQVKDKLAHDKNFKLVSIRSKDEFDGKTSGYTYINRAGEPLGAVWGHDTDDGSYVTKDGTTVGLDKLTAYLNEAGVKPTDNISFYCGTGWRAAIPFLIAHQNGMKNVTLYDGGWFVWQMDGNNPVQLGDPNSSNCEKTTVDKLTTDKAKPKKQ